MTRNAHRHARGMSLLELMVALTILAVGILGMLRLHIIGISSNNGGRLHSVGDQVAQELLQGLERLGYTDPLLSVNGTTSPTAPAGFGSVLDPSTRQVATGLDLHAWSDTTPVPGVRLDTEVPAYQRRWRVWGYSPTAGGGSTVKVIAVSVVWTEPAFSTAREVLLYTQIYNPATFLSNLSANQ